MIAYLLTLLVLWMPSDHATAQHRVLNSRELHLTMPVAFDFGERMVYRVHYGIINAGEAEMRVGDQVEYVNGHPCYDVQVTGRTTGFWRKVVRIQDNWSSKIDTAKLQPVQFRMDIQEAGYRHKELLDFKSEMDTVVLSKLDRKTGELQGKEGFSIPDHVQDIVSGFYFLRNIDFSKIEKGTLMEFTGFFDKKVHHMKIRFDGRTTIKTDMGKRKALILVPVMPDNETFEKDSPITAYLSDDEHKIPLKVKAELLVGSAEVTIKKYYPGHKKAFKNP
ncbi:DUF3108 domain-containing protein [Persicobacter psychrovividus]|uniref:DUF3108 domain-containing protein n=1 Tax=Persicobacter psychrovividus TaxID=387638 RepID=A0ABN6L9Q3_9BACT|nr:hypothetical protein PEPS_22010 [Persicobacter psychrovividus]